MLSCMCYYFVIECIPISCADLHSLLLNVRCVYRVIMAIVLCVPGVIMVEKSMITEG